MIREAEPRPRPTLSVLVAHYNHGDYIEAALNAICAQSWQPLEIVLLDDASNDGSLEVVRRLAQRNPLIRLVEHESNLGVIAVFNRLVAEASGDYVIGCAADDVVLPGLFESR